MRWHGREVLQDQRPVLLRAVAAVRCRGRRTPTWAPSSSMSPACPTRARSRSSRASGTPLTPGGFHNMFVYHHSDGHTYLVTTVNGPHTNVYDLGKVVARR